MAQFKADSLTEVNKIINEKIMPEKVRKWTAFAWKGLVLKTPHDTYTAANSWIVTADIPSREKPEYKNYPGFPRMPGYLRSGSKFRVTFSGGNYDIIYIVNNQDYIMELERGKSTRFPSPWIRPTITQMVVKANAGAI